MSRQLRFEVGTIGSKSAADQWSENLDADGVRLATASTNAYRGAGKLAKVRGRLAIAAGGFSTRWQNALRVDVYPVGNRVSLRPAIRMWHNIVYAGVFEKGDTIKGTPYLWLPVGDLPKRTGEARLTPLSFERITGQKLVPFRDPHSGNLLLGVRIKVKKKGVTKLSLSRLRRGADAPQGILTTVPVFVGIRKVSISKKFDLHGVMEQLVGDIDTIRNANMEAL